MDFQQLKSAYLITKCARDMVTIRHLQTWVLTNNPSLNPTIEELHTYTLQFLHTLAVPTKWVRLNGVDTEVAVGLIPHVREQ